MSAIAGIWTEESTNVQAIGSHLTLMGHAMRHRGQHEAQKWHDDKQKLALLTQEKQFGSATKSKKQGIKQPLLSPSQRYVLCLDGRIYNHMELRKALRAAGYKFKTEQDIETLAAAIEEWGLDETLPRLNGAFAFALWDRKESNLRLARDRFGEKPLYIGWIGRNLVFASEVKAFRQHPDMRPEIDRIALKAYLRFGFIPAPYCIYSGIMQLPAGAQMSVNLTALSAKAKLESLIQPWWNSVQEARRGKRDLRDTAESVPENEHGAITQTLKTLESIVENHMAQEGTKDTVCLLSSGLDSSLLATLMQAQSSERLKTLTVGFEGQNVDETGPAKRIALQLHTDHKSVQISEDNLRNLIPQLPDIADEPLADPSLLSGFMMAQCAKDQADIVISGDGSDSVFGGFKRHIHGAKIWQNMQGLPRSVRSFTGKMLMKPGLEFWQKLRPKNPKFGQKIIRSARSFSANSEDDLYKLFLSVWEDPDSLMQDDIRDEAYGMLGKGSYMAATDEDPLSFTELMMASDTLHHIGSGILPGLDHINAQASIERRLPMLDHRLYQLAWRLPLDMKVRGRESKWILRQILYRFLPRELIYTSTNKQTLPLAAWLRGPLKQWAAGLLDPANMRAQGYLYPAQIQQLWREHLTGRIDHSRKLWVILMWQLWYERWMT